MFGTSKIVAALKVGQERDVKKYKNRSFKGALSRGFLRFGLNMCY